MAFAGHPTLGTAIAVQKHFGFNGLTITQDCPAGLIDIRFDVENKSVHLIAPDSKMDEISELEKERLAKALSLEVPIKVAAKIDAGPIWITVLIDSAETVERLQPDLALVKSLADKLGATGVVIGALKTDGKTYKVRTFAPSVGVPEDPVCGSGNVAVALLRLQQGNGRENYLSSQGQEMGRDGEVQICYLSSGHIELGGKTNITAFGEIFAV